MSCFRDDIVFLLYLYQRHIYPVDKSRGMAYNGVAEAVEDDNGDRWFEVAREAMPSGGLCHAFLLLRYWRIICSAAVEDEVLVNAGHCYWLCSSCIFQFVFFLPVPVLSQGAFDEDFTESAETEDQE